MGLSASQARLMSLTSRLSDLELKAQSISNSKIRLADASTEASKAYNLALDKEKLTVFSGVNATTGEYVYKDATAFNLTNYQKVSATDKQRILKTAGGQVIVSATIGAAMQASGGNMTTLMNSLVSAGIITNDQVENATPYYTSLYNEIVANRGITISNEEANSSEWLYAQLNSGNIFISEWNSNAGADGKGDFVDVSWTSGDSSVVTKSDKTELAKAEAEYETTMSEIKAKDQKFDLELKSIDTEHNAIQTEMDSVKKVMDKNIERTFKIFDA